MIRIMSDVLFSGLLALARGRRKLAAGETLFRAGDPVQALFLVEAGRMRLVRALPHGFQLTIQRAGPGSVLAEASLFADRYHCEAVATDAALLRTLPRPRLEAALAGDAGLARAWAAHLAREVQRARASAEILSLKTVGDRLDAWLALNDGGLPAKGGWRLIASEIGVSPEALYREIARRRINASASVRAAPA